MQRPVRRRFPCGCPPVSAVGLLVGLFIGCAEPQPVEPGPQDPDAPREFTEVDRGLKYRILRQGDGEQPGPTDSVTVHYRGWLDDGTVFDSSYERGEPATFGLDQVIDGWGKGLQYVREGGMIELEIPPELGYGSRTSPPIPPNATLHFLVELIEVQ